MRVTCLLLLLLPASSGAQDKKTDMPPGVMPSIVLLKSVDREKRIATYMDVRTRTVPVTRFQVVMENGVAKMVPVTVNTTVQEMVINTIQLQESRIFDANGNLVEMEDALKRLVPGESVVLSPDQNMIHPAYARILRENTIVLTRNPTVTVPPMPPK